MKNVLAQLDQRLLFLLVGGLSTAFGYGVFVVVFLLFPTWPYLIVLVVAYVLASFFAFTAQKVVVFKAKGSLFLDYLRYNMVGLGALALNAGLLTLFVEVVEAPVLVAQAVATVAVVVSSYFGHRYFSFRRNKALQAAE